jgi:uncharacterized membrane protein
MEEHGHRVLFLREVLLSSYIVVVPGYLIMRGLRMHDYSPVKALILAVCFSLAFVMFLGVLLNEVFIQSNWERPFDTGPVLTSIILSTVLLSLVAWARDRTYSAERPFSPSIYLSTPALLLYCLPLFAVVSTYLINLNGNNSFQILLILMIGTIPVLQLVTRFFPRRLYPLAIFSAGFALLLHCSLVSNQMVEWADVSFEFWSANRVTIFGYWDFSIGDRTNTVLSISILAPMITVASGLDLTIVFKVVYPALFALVPLAMYELLSNKLHPALCFYAMFFLVSLSSFYTDMLGLNRQMIGELFLVGFILIFMEKKLSFPLKLSILLVFGFSIAVSHYGLLMIFVVCLFISWLLTALWSLISPNNKINVKMVAMLILSVIGFTLVWYTIVSNSYMADIIINSFNQLLLGFWEFRGTESSQILRLFNLNNPSMLDYINIIIYYSSIFLILLGFAYLLARRKSEQHFDIHYTTLSIAFFVSIVSGAYSPNIFNFISESRMYHLSMIVLAPMMIFGGYTAIRKMSSLIFKKKNWPERVANTTICGFIVVVLLMSSGLVNLALDSPSAYELSPDEVTRANFNNVEAQGAKWASSVLPADQAIRGDAHMAYLMKMYTGHYWPLYTRDGANVYMNLPEDTVYFCGTDNVNGNIWLEDPAHFRINKTYIAIDSRFALYLYNQNMIFNGQGTVFYYDNA